jgi:hypothetical protein
MAKHFSTVAATQSGLRYHVHGIDEPEAGDYQNDTAVFRITGPTVHQGSGTYEWYGIEMMILLTDIPELTGESAYEIDGWAGVFQGSMVNDALSIYRYGSGVGDDDSLVGCLFPDPTVRNNVRVVDYGEVDPNLRLHQMAVIGKFILDLE